MVRYGTVRCGVSDMDMTWYGMMNGGTSNPDKDKPHQTKLTITPAMGITGVE